MYNSKPRNNIFHPPKVRFKGGKELGEKWEWKVCKLLQDAGHGTIVPTSTLDKGLDSQKVDVMPKSKNWVDFPFHVQCKSRSGALKDYPKLLSQIPTDKIPVLFHQQTKEEEGDFQEVATYAILKLEDFLYLTQHTSF